MLAGIAISSLFNNLILENSDVLRFRQATFCLFGFRHLVTFYCKIDGQPLKILIPIESLNNEQKSIPIPPFFFSIGSLSYNRSASNLLACYMCTSAFSFVPEKNPRIDLNVSFSQPLAILVSTNLTFSQCVILRQPEFFVFLGKPKYRKFRQYPPYCPQKTDSEMETIPLISPGLLIFSFATSTSQ